MAVSRLSKQSIQQSFPKGNTIWDGNTSISAFDSLAVVVVGSGGTTSVVLSNIPQTYTHLQLRVSARDQGSGGYDDIDLRLNGDSGTNYTFHQLKGNGVSASAYAQAAPFHGGAPLFPLNSQSSNTTVTSAIIDILDYTSTGKYKTMRSLFGWDSNGAGDVGLRSSVWLNTAAVTSISFVNYGTPYFSQYSTIALYGIK